jgi:hypothetical protein
MRTITRTVKKQKIVWENEDKQIFITDDGKEFETETAALNHESRTERVKIFYEKFKFKRIELEKSYEAIFMNDFDRETLQLLHTRYAYNSFKTDSLKIGWNLIDIDDSGDYTNVYVFQPEELLKEYSKYCSVLKDLT